MTCNDGTLSVAFSYDPIGNYVATTNYDETGAAIVSEYAANSLNQYTSRTVPGVAAVRGFADADATVTVNENPAYRLGEYFYGSDDFDNSAAPVDAALVTTAALASPTNGPDEVASVTSRVHIAKSPQPFEYDLDGNQTLVTTKTGTWRVTYNGENRPVRWTRINAADTNAQTMISMNFDHQGRRRLYLEVAGDGSTNRLDRFTYDNYLCVARNRWQPDGTSATDRFVWDPTEPIATRPLICDLFGVGALFYCHDGNKNVSEAVTLDGTIAAHYEYSSFGKVVLVTSENEDQSMANLNPYRFSSEYADDALGLVYYNYRHYEPVAGRWLSRDLMGEFGGQSLYSHVENRLEYDFLGLARMITFARRKWNAAYAGEDKAALKLMRLVENLNKMTKGGCPCFEIVFKDLVGATIESIQNDASSYDEVFIYSHAALRINGKIRTPSSYEWTGDDVVEELLCTDYKGSYLSVDALVKAGILIDNIFACYITKGHRKVGGGWFSNPVSTISQQAENITQLADRLRSIAQGLDNCEKKKKVVIYEGQRNSKNLWYGTERALQDPLPYEEE